MTAAATGERAGMGGPFAGVVFAGGGSRCFWQLGFWEVVAPELGLPGGLRAVAGVSAGAAMACVALLGRGRRTLEMFQTACAENSKNAYLGNLLRPGARVFPHEAMYRRAVQQIIDPPALRRLQDGPDVRIYYGRPPRLLGSTAGLIWGLLCYLAEKRAGDPVHGDLARRAGFESDVESVRACQTPAELADLILASSCTPPFTPALRRGGRPVIDGGVVQSAPLCALHQLGPGARILVLLSRTYGTMPPPHPDRVYVGPSRPLDVSKWDYTDPRGLQVAFDLGLRDGEQALREGTLGRQIE